MHPTKAASYLSLATLAGLNVLAWELPIGGEKVDLHGFGSQGFLYSSDYNYLGKTTDGSFEYNEFGLNASISPFKRTRITAQGFMFDLGNVGNYKPFLDYAAVEYTFNDYIGVRGGRVRRPGGIYNHIQDVDLARTSVLLPQGVYDPRWRDFSTSVDGGLLFGNVPLGKAGSLSYEAFAGYIRLSDEGGVARLLQNSLPPAPIGAFNGLDSSLNVGAQLWWNTPLEGLRFGGLYGKVFDFTWHIAVNPPFGAGGMRTEADIPYGQLSLEYTYDGWTFQAEYYTYNVFQNDFLEVGPLIGTSRTRTDAWYVSASKRVNSWLELGTYYSEFYPNAANRSGNSDRFQKDVAFSTRFDLTDWWIFKLEGHYIRGTGQLYNNALNPVRDDNGWWMFAAKTTFSF